MSNCSLHASRHTAGHAGSSSTPQSHQRRPSVRRGRDLSLHCASTPYFVSCTLGDCGNILPIAAHALPCHHWLDATTHAFTGVADGQGNSPSPSRGWWSPFGRSTQSSAHTSFSLLGFGRRAPVPTRIVVPFDLAQAEQLLVVGDTQQLGRWDPQAAPAMQRLQGSLYTHQVNLRPGDYKFKVVS